MRVIQFLAAVVLFSIHVSANADPPVRCPCFKAEWVAGVCAAQLVRGGECIDVNYYEGDWRVLSCWNNADHDNSFQFAAENLYGTCHVTMCEPGNYWCHGIGPGTNDIHRYIDTAEFEACVAEIEIAAEDLGICIPIED